MEIFNPTNIYFVRHGESLANVRKHVGEFSAPLSAIGRKQAVVLSNNLKFISFDGIFSSGYRRAKETADIIAQERKTKVVVDRRLDEWNIGKLDGVSQTVFDQETQGYFHPSQDVKPSELFKIRLFPEMETPEETVSRMISFINERSQDNQGKNILSVSHGAVLGFLLIHLGKLTLKDLPDFGKIIPNSSFIKISSNGAFLKSDWQR
jgi:broad specificity phosphatase PhoE